MKFVKYLIRFLLALFFMYVAIDKILNQAVPRDEIGMQTEFVSFYELILKSGYLYFVCFFEFLCGFLLLFKRTYLLGAIMFVPLLLCLLMVHVFISKNGFYLIFDSCLFIANASLITPHFKELRQIFLKPQQGWI